MTSTTVWIHALCVRDREYPLIAKFRFWHFSRLAATATVVGALVSSVLGFASPTPASASMPDWCTAVAENNYEERGSLLIYNDWAMDACVIAHVSDINSADPDGAMNVVDRANRLAIEGQRSKGYVALNVAVVYWLTQQWITLPKCWGTDSDGVIFTVEQTTFKDSLGRIRAATRVNWLYRAEAKRLNYTAVPHCDLPRIPIG